MLPTETIRVAISQQRYLALTHDNAFSVIEPRLLGTDAGGRLVMSGYEVARERPASGGDWRTYAVNEIRRLRLLPGSYRDRPHAGPMPRHGRRKAA